VGKDESVNRVSALPTLPVQPILIPSVLQLLDQLAMTHMSPLLDSNRGDRTAALAFLTSQLSSTSSASADSIWSSLFTKRLKPEALRELIGIVASRVLPASMGTAGIDETVKGYAASILELETVNEVELQIVELLVQSPRSSHPLSPTGPLTDHMLYTEHFISSTTPQHLIDLFTVRLVDLTRRALSSNPPSLSLLTPPIRILASYVKIPANGLLDASARSGALAAFEISNLLPNSRLTELVSSQTQQLAGEIWKAVVGEELGTSMMERLSEYVVDASICAS
jgi:hypothetical protein